MSDKIFNNFHQIITKSLNNELSLIEPKELAKEINEYMSGDDVWHISKSNLMQLFCATIEEHEIKNKYDNTEIRFNLLEKLIEFGLEKNLVNKIENTLKENFDVDFDRIILDNFINENETIIFEDKESGLSTFSLTPKEVHFSKNHFNNTWQLSNHKTNQTEILFERNLKNDYLKNFLIKNNLEISKNRITDVYLRVLNRENISNKIIDHIKNPTKYDRVYDLEDISMEDRNKIYLSVAKKLVMKNDGKLDFNSIKNCPSISQLLRSNIYYDAFNATLNKLDNISSEKFINNFKESLTELSYGDYLEMSPYIEKSLSEINSKTDLIKDVEETYRNLENSFNGIKIINKVVNLIIALDETVDPVHKEVKSEIINDIVSGLDKNDIILISNGLVNQLKSEEINKLLENEILPKELNSKIKEINISKNKSLDRGKFNQLRII